MNQSQRPQGPLLGRSAAVAVLGALVGVGAYVGLGFATEQLSSLFAILVGFGSGVGARLGAGERSLPAGLVAALLSGLAVAAANIALSGAFPAVLEVTFMLKTSAIAGITGVGIGYGSRLTESILAGASGSGGSFRGGGASSPSDQQGMLECPSCGSIQTESHDVDRGGQVGAFVCNACDHTWVP